ncbi:MAG: LysM peptidoglycan-binding domain-containing protein [Saprospiraceae bacterium]|nr:LysM peptidoglycan-binding domain-containing protein [Saprospiraceae bacterium]
MIRVFSLILILFGFTIIAYSQNYSPESDIVLVQFDAQNKPYIQHQVSKGQTIFSLRSRYGLSESEFLAYNSQIKDKQLHLDHWIRIPVGHLIQYSTDTKANENFKSVYYKIQAKENLYSISKNRTEWDPNTIVQQNKLKSNTLNLDQILKIGYLIFFDSRISAPVKTETPSINKDTNSVLTNSSKSESNQKLKLFTNETRGVAITSGSNNGRNYALHNKAKKGSWIEVYNPVLERSVLAKVIGKIPGNYGKEIQVVVSASVAENVGAIGNKFFVYLRF